MGEGRRGDEAADRDPARGGVALVAGAGGGIGRATAVLLARRGFDVALLGRRADPLEETARLVASRAPGRRALVVTGDAAARADVDAALGRVRGRLGDPSVLVNSVGVARASPLLPPDDALFDETFRANVRAAWVLSTAVLPACLAARRGRIVHVASSASKRAFRYTTAYVASKHAVLGLVRALAADLAGTGVTVHAVCPGFVDTEMTRRSVERVERATGKSRDDALGALLATGGQERLLGPEEVAEAVASLCGEDVRIPSGEAVDL